MAVYLLRLILPKLSDSCQQSWLNISYSGLFRFCGFHPMGEKPKMTEALALQDENYIQVKESLNLGVMRI